MTERDRSRLFFAVQKFRDATIELDQSLSKANSISGQRNYPFEKSFPEVASEITIWLDTLNQEINTISE